MKNVVKKLEENGKGDQVDGFKKNIQPYISEILKDWKDLMFFVGECNNKCQYVSIYMSEPPRQHSSLVA